MNRLVKYICYLIIMYRSMFSSLCSIPDFTEDYFKEHILLTMLLSHFPLTWYFTVTFIQTTVHTSVPARSYLAKRSSEVKIGSWIVFPYWIKTLPHCSIFTLTIIIFSLPFIFFFFFHFLWWNSQNDEKNMSGSEFKSFFFWKLEIKL